MRHVQFCLLALGLSLTACAAGQILGHTYINEAKAWPMAMVYDSEGGKLIEESRHLVKNLTEASQHLNEISEKIARGEGILGGFLVDPTLYEDLTALLDGTQRSWLLRSVIQRTLESGRQAQKDKRTAEVKGR
ncbi:MAG: hypothetical protein C3F12_02655 [Candidatus Methylomirabilota bacterium]|nr:MAG: hypothetical protein C3F12_02655 [candidate division NC10 bacterium]